jgi:hypothetical protein
MGSDHREQPAERVVVERARHSNDRPTAQLNLEAHVRAIAFATRTFELYLLEANRREPGCLIQTPSTPPIESLWIEPVLTRERRRR